MHVASEVEVEVEGESPGAVKTPRNARCVGSRRGWELHGRGDGRAWGLVGGRMTVELTAGRRPGGRGGRVAEKPMMIAEGPVTMAEGTVMMVEGPVTTAEGPVMMAGSVMGGSIVARSDGPGARQDA